ATTVTSRTSRLCTTDSSLITAMTDLRHRGVVGREPRRPRTRVTTQESLAVTSSSGRRPRVQQADSTPSDTISYQHTRPRGESCTKFHDYPRWGTPSDKARRRKVRAQKQKNPDRVRASRFRPGLNPGVRPFRSPIHFRSPGSPDPPRECVNES